MQSTGQTAAQGGSVQCMQAIEIERSPGWPSLSVMTRRRCMPQGTSCSFLQAVVPLDGEPLAPAAGHLNPGGAASANARRFGVRRVDLSEHLLLQLGKPL